MKTKEKVYNLRLENKSYSEISKILNISKATVSYHCQNLDMNAPIKGAKISNEDIINIKIYYKTHTTEETAKQFNVSKSSVIKYVDNKMIKFSDYERKIKNYKKVLTRRQKLKEMAVEYKGGKCVICGYDKCIWALEFHHRNPKERDFGISVYNNLAWEKIKSEIEKCDLLCSNCHKELHHQNWDISPLPDKQ